MTSIERQTTCRPPTGHLVALRPSGHPGQGPLRPFDPLSPSALETIFPPIADYAFLSDCENTCLVAPTGAIEWLCLPRPHDPSVFGTLLDRAAGSFRLAPADTAVPANRRYVPGTMVLATTWQTPNGWLAVRDFMAVGPWHRTSDRSTLHRRTPGDFDAMHVLVRTATCPARDGRTRARLRAGLRLRPGRCPLGVCRAGVRSGHDDQSRFHHPHVDRGPADGHRRAGSPRPTSPQRGRVVPRSAELVRSSAAGRHGRGVFFTHRDQSLLARDGSMVGGFPTIRGESTSSGVHSP